VDVLFWGSGGFLYTIWGLTLLNFDLPLTTKCKFNTLTAAKCELSVGLSHFGGSSTWDDIAYDIRSLVQVATMSVAGVSQSIAAVAAVGSMVGGGGVQGGNGMDQRSSMDQGSGMDHRVGLGGHLVGVGIRSGHRMGHNGGGVALDDGGMRDHGRSSIGRSQGVSVSQSIAMAIGRNQTGIGHGAQGRDEGDLRSGTMI